MFRKALAALFLAALAAAQQTGKPRLLIVTGANNHDWKWTAFEIRGVLEECERFDVDLTEDPARDLADASVVSRYAAFVLDYNGPRWGSEAEAVFLQAVRSGAGVVVVHAADNSFPDWDDYAKLVGLCWRDGTSGHGAYHAFDIAVVDHAHPITEGLADLRRHPDELYHRLVPTPGSECRVLLSAYSDPKTGGTGRHEPMATAATFGKGRVFHTALGHTWTGAIPTRATWSDPQFRLLLQRGAEWAATGAVTLPARPINFLAEDERKEGFELLFDGRSLAGFKAFRRDGLPDRGWTVRHGAIFHEKNGGGGDLLTEARFGDFDLRFQWRIGAGGNSGVIWHVLETEKDTYRTGPEYQILDDLGVKPDPKHSAGALYDLVGTPPGKPVRPPGEWNDGRIVVRDGKVQHWLNGALLLESPCTGPDWDAMVAKSKFRDWPFGRSAAGHIAFQDHGDEVAYRSIRIRRL
ncbi:MAG: DUF1080 domain-containing protein [Planctomycetota bacterium]